MKIKQVDLWKQSFIEIDSFELQSYLIQCSIEYYCNKLIAARFHALKTDNDEILLHKKNF